MLSRQDDFLVKTKGNRMKETIKLSLQEELERETEELKKEIEQHPDLAEINVSEEMDAVFFARAHALEKVLQEERLREEAEFAEELMPEMEHPKKEDTTANPVDEEKKPVVRYRKKRKRALWIILAAAFILVMGMSMTAVGSKSYLKVWWERFNGEGMNSTKMLNVDDMDAMNSEDGEEVAAYKKVEEELGIYVVRMMNKPEGMSLEDVQIDESLTQARFFYRYGDEMVRYNIYLNDRDSSRGQKEGDKVINEYQMVVKDVEVTIREYEVEDYKEYRRMADFVYRDVHYQLKGVMEKDEFENIINNLHFF